MKAVHAIHWPVALLCCALWAADLAGADADAAESRALTLDQAVQTALSYHPLLRQAELDIGTAELRVKQARSSRLPQIDAGGLAKLGLSGAANLFGLSGLASSPEPEGMAFSGTVFQDLADFKRSKFESRARQAEVEYFEHTLVAEERSLILRVQEAYYAGLKAQAQIALAQAMVEENTLAGKRAASLHQAELGSKADANLAQVRLSRARLGLARATQSLRQALAGLATAMGEPTTQVYALQESESAASEPEPLETLLAEGREHRPELAAVDAKVRAGEAWVRRAQREKYPRIMTMFSGGWTRFAELTLSRLLFGGFGLQLPLFTGGRVKATIEETKLGLEKTKAVREQLLRAIDLQVTEAHSDLVAALEASQTAAEGVAQAREAAKLQRIRYENDLAALLEWKSAQTALAGAENERNQALYDYKIAESDLDFAIGRRSY